MQRKGSKALVVGLKQSLQSYFLREFDAPIQRVFLTGGGALLGNLQPWLEKRLSLPVHVLDVGGLSFNNAASDASMVGAKAVGLTLLQLPGV